MAALKLHPMFNATLDDGEGEIIVKKYYNIGIAVDVPDGLIVPVIKGADEKSVWTVAQEIQTLAEAACGRLARSPNASGSVSCGKRLR